MILNRLDQLKQDNWVLKTIRSINHLIIKENDKNQLLRGICQNLHRNQGFGHTWIILLEGNSPKEPFFHSGLEQEFAPMTALLHSKTLPSCAYHAIKKNKIMAIKNSSKECLNCPFQSTQKCEGYTIILKHGLITYGWMTLSNLKTTINKHKLVNMIEEIARDISYALWTLELNEGNLDKERDERQTISNLIMNSQQPIAVIHFDDRLNIYNPAFCQLTGYTQGELQSMDSPLEITTPQGREFEKDLFSSFKDDENSIRYEKEYKRKDGTLVPVEIFANIKRNQNGAIETINAFITNIDNRKKAEKERDDLIHEMRERTKELSCLYKISEIIRKRQEMNLIFEDVIETIPSGWQYPSITRGRIHIFNKNYQSSTFVESPWKIKADLIIEEEKRGFVEVYYLEEKPQRDEGPFLKEERDLINGIANMLSEAYELKHIDKERDMLVQAIEQAAETIVITDSKANIRYVNPAFVKTTGYSKKEAEGKKPSILKSGEQDDSFYQKMWETLYSGKTWSGKFINKKKDGTTYTEEAVLTPVLNDSGEIVNFVGVKRDITKELALEAQLHQAQKMEAVGRLAGGVAHDFNNMLGVIMGYSDILMETLEKDSPQREYLLEIQNASSRSADLTRQLLTFARKQAVTPRVIDLNKTVYSMNKMLQRLIGEDINLHWEPCKGLWNIKIDPRQVDQILANLSINARDAIEDVGSVTIRTENYLLDRDFSRKHQGSVPGEYVKLTIKDTGKGISTDVLKHIFEPFFTTKQEGKGTGLGLSMIYGVVKQNNGFIDVSSKVEQGTTFTIYIPRYKGKEKLWQKIEKKKESAKGDETILIVEDESSILKLTQKILKKSGYDVLTADSPQKAQELIQSYRENIQLILTDVVMPNMNGKELFEKTRKTLPQMKCIFMSGYTANVIAQHGILDDGINFIHKPFSEIELTTKVREVLDSD